MAISVQQARILHYMRNSDLHTFINMLESPELLETKTLPHERIRL